MKNLKKLERLQQLHQRIQNENTGSPIEMARYMNMSQRSIHNLIDELKVLGAEICYKRTTKTYYYCNEFDLKVSISVDILTNNEVTRIFGGSYFLKNNLLSTRFLH